MQRQQRDHNELQLLQLTCNLPVSVSCIVQRLLPPNYMDVEILAAYQKAVQPDMGNNNTSEVGLTIEVITDPVWLVGNAEQHGFPADTSSAAHGLAVRAAAF